MNGTAFWTVEGYKTKSGCPKVSLLSTPESILPTISSAASMSSTTSLLPSESKQQQQQQQPSPQSQKNWALAFATLSSKYGFSGKAPSVPQNSSKPRDSSTCDAESPPVQKTQPLTGYELAFGQLASNYGFGGAVTSTSQHKK